jgi:tetratricopeptide (TPR) repeat protein
MIYQQLLHLCAIDKTDEESLRRRFPEAAVCTENEKCIEFCEYLSKIWIMKTLSELDNELTSYEKVIKSVVSLQPDPRRVSQDCDEILIYSYFLYFCGILPVIGIKITALKRNDKEVDKKQREVLENDLDNIKKFFEDRKNPERTKKRNEAIFNNFLVIYIHIIDPRLDDLEVFENLRECFRNDIDNIIFTAISKEYEIMKEIMDITLSDPKKFQARIDIRHKKIRGVFPKAGDKYIKENSRKIIYSIMESGLARLYFIANDIDMHEIKVDVALDKNNGYPYNAFALVQKAHLLCMDRYKKRDLHQARNEFMRVIKLIEDDNQFKSIPAFRYRIEFEAMLGLAYIDYSNGLDSKAEMKYYEAENLARVRLTKEVEYLVSIVLINRGRSRLDNGIARSNSNAKKDFEEVIRIYQNAKIEIKQELVEIAALAHNNLGVCYLNEGRYSQAEDEFNKSINMNDTNPHAKYNLGVLYHKKGEKDRSITLIKNASYLDPKFKEAEWALSKLGAEKRSSLGAEWFDWWFRNQEATGRKKVGQRISALKIITITTVLLVMITSLGKLAYDLYIHDFVNIAHMTMQPGTSNEYTPHEHEIGDENAYLIVFGICIVIILLPFINKLKMGSIEIEVESAGYRPVGPTSVTVGMTDEHRYEIRYEFFFARFWY